MIIRLLDSSEEFAWCALDGGAPDEARVQALIERRRQLDPREFVVAVENGRITGKLRGSFYGEGEFVVEAVVVASPTCSFEDVGARLLQFVVAELPEDVELNAAAYLTPDKAVFHTAMAANGFEPHGDKLYVARELSQKLPSYPDELTYLSLLDVGREHFLRIFAAVNVGSLSAEVRELEPNSELDSMVAVSGSCFDPAHCITAWLAGEPVGLACPQRFWDAPEQGTIFHIGVVPEQRGHGLGRVLHAKSLGLLKAAGAQSYIGSTDVENVAMRAVFRVNGCREKGVRRYYRHAR
jgi:GNAT superfamily N-acetyltransferase